MESEDVQTQSVEVAGIWNLCQIEAESETQIWGPEEFPPSLTGVGHDVYAGRIRSRIDRIRSRMGKSKARHVRASNHGCRAWFPPFVP